MKFWSLIFREKWGLGVWLVFMVLFILILLLQIFIGFSNNYSEKFKLKEQDTQVIKNE